MEAKIKPPLKTEFSRADKAKLMAQALIDGMIQNPDKILRGQAGGRLDVYKDILRDDQVISTFQQRRRAVVNAEYYVEPASKSPIDKEIADFVAANLKAIGFDRVTDKMLYATHYGYSVGEIIWHYSDKFKRIAIEKIKVRDRARFKFGVNGELFLTDNAVKPELMPREKFWVHTVGADHDDNPYGEGLANALYWPVFFKRNGIKFWMVFLEKYGMPTATAKLNQSQMQDPNQRNLALSVLDAIHQDSGVVVPEDFVIELIEASRSGTVDYSTLTARMDAAIAKIVLSQTMTTDNGSSRSQSETHKDVRDEVVKSDADLICESFAEQVVKQLVEINYPGADIPQVWRKTEPEEDLVQLAERDNKIMNLGFEPTEQYIKETYGPGWRKKAPETVPPTAGNNPVPEMGPEFAEVSPLTDKRVQHRRDQQTLIDAADMLGSKYREVYGKRIEQLLAYAENTNDMQTFKKRLLEMMAEPAPEETVEAVTNATWAARLMGLFKGSKA
jgi:phage gp29-like protein